MPSIEVASTNSVCNSPQWNFSHVVKDTNGATVAANFITLSSDRVFSIESSNYSDIGLYTIEVTATWSGSLDIVRSFNLEIQGTSCTKFSDFAFSKYTIHEEPLNWQAAEDSCKAEGGHLISFHSFDERDKVFDLAQMPQNYFIGLNDHD